jgi:monofunctional glycosyltransferase
MIKKLGTWLLKLVAGFVAASVLLALLYRFVPPPLTPLMVIRLFEGALESGSAGASASTSDASTDGSAGSASSAGDDNWWRIQHTWVPLEDISPNLQRAVIASEDARFLDHTGIDWNAIGEASRRNERAQQRAEERRKRGKTARPKLYGASTISMQTAKNVFLPPSRNYVRKAFEAYFTWLIELCWGKRRILEVYLNMIEMGKGIYGAEAAAQAYFGKSAARLSQSEAALITAALPDPRHRSPSKPSAYLQRRAARIQARMVGVALPQQSSAESP